MWNCETLDLTPAEAWRSLWQEITSKGCEQHPMHMEHDKGCIVRKGGVREARDEVGWREGTWHTIKAGSR